MFEVTNDVEAGRTYVIILLRQEDAEENGMKRFYVSYQITYGRTVTGHPHGLGAQAIQLVLSLSCLGD